MAEPDDLAVGAYVLKHDLIPRAVLLDCLFETVAERRGERARGFARPLGIVLHQRGLLKEEALREVVGQRMGARAALRLRDLPLGDLLVGLGYATSEHVQEALALQKEAHAGGAPRPRLGEILVERGRVTAEQVARGLAYQMKEIYRCTRCAVRVNLTNPRPDQDHHCQRCGGLLVPAEPGAIGVHESGVAAPVAADARGSREAPLDETRTVPLADLQQAEIDRAVDLYIRQNGLARRETVREARRVQMEIARYGIDVPLLEVLQRTKALTWQQQQALEKVDFKAVIARREWQEQAVPGYQAFRKIAVGGFGVIYLAKPIFGDQRVALKVLRPEHSSDESAVRRLKSEAALLRRFDHPGIIRGGEYGRQEGTHFVVMEYFDGVSLGQAIAERSGFSPQTAVAIVRQIVEALDYMRREGYLHRDIKPDNILVDAQNRAKLCDLGFAASIEETASGPARAKTVGTAGYVSPEQARGEVDVKVGTDIYSLGITLYAMLAGFEPFTGASSEVMVSEFIEGGLPAPDLLRIKAPPAVVEVVRRMTHPDRERRFRAHGEVLEALDTLKL